MLGVIFFEFFFLYNRYIKMIEKIERKIDIHKMLDQRRLIYATKLVFSRDKDWFIN